MSDLNELRDRAATFGSDYLTDEEWVEVIDRLEAAKKECDELRTRRMGMTKDEFRKAVDDVIEDCIRNDYTFGSYAHRVTDAVWPLFEAAEKEATQQRILAKEALRAAERREKKCDALRAKIAEMERQEPAGTVETLFDEHVIKYNNFDKNAPVYFAPCVQAQSAPSVPGKVEVREDKEGEIFSRGSYNEGYDNGWNDCIDAMLNAAPSQEK